MLTNAERIDSGHDHSAVRAYTDGACSGNPGPGGWGVVIEQGDSRTEHSGGEAQTTNNRMELTAAIKALEHTAKDEPIAIVTDATYVHQGITQWIAGWKRRAWRSTNGKLIANRDLWERLDLACAGRTVQWQWVRGHTGHPGNERADALARAQAKQRRETHTRAQEQRIATPISAAILRRHLERCDPDTSVRTAGIAGTVAASTLAGWLASLPGSTMLRTAAPIELHAPHPGH